MLDNPTSVTNAGGEGRYKYMFLTCVSGNINGFWLCSVSEWSEDEDGGASEPLLNDRESTGYTTDDPALENISMINEAGLTDAEGLLKTSLH